MNRRDALSRVALLLGGTIIGGMFFSRVVSLAIKNMVQLKLLHR